MNDDTLKSLEQSFRNRQMTRYMPQRIKRKRVKQRVRVVYTLNAKRVYLIELPIKCQGGLYIKEFIHGDGGRAQPSVTGILGVEAVPIELVSSM